MTKPKTLDQLRAEKERAETQLAQEKHKLERLENRKKYLEKGERTKRTHRLCNLGGTIESLAPEVKDLTRTEMTELMEHIFSLSEVQQAVRHMAITHISQANREKELKADGTISSERHADYRQKHESDFIIADAAARYFRENGISKLPSYKALQAEIETLIKEKNSGYNDYRAKREEYRRLQTVKGNIDQILRRERKPVKKQEQER